MEDSTLKVPARMVRELRNGLHSLLGQAAQDVSVITDRRGRERFPEWYREPLGRFDRARALLDLLGWGDPCRAADVMIDASEHGWALVKALEVALIVGDDELKEAGLVDEERAVQGKPPREGETVLGVFVVREYLTTIEEHLSRLGVTAEDER